MKTKTPQTDSAQVRPQSTFTFAHPYRMERGGGWDIGHTGSLLRRYGGDVDVLIDGEEWTLPALDFYAAIGPVLPDDNTPGTLHVEEQSDIDIDGNGYRFALRLRRGSEYAQNPAYACTREKAERLALCWNSHEALLQLARALVADCEAGRECVDDNILEGARAAITKATTI